MSSAEQIVNRARVLGAIQPLERSPARRCFRRRFRVETRFKRLSKRGQLIVGGTPRAGRRHLPRPEFADHPLADLALGSGLAQLEARQREVAVLDALVVTGDARVLYEGLRGGGAVVGGDGSDASRNLFRPDQHGRREHNSNDQDRQAPDHARTWSPVPDARSIGGALRAKVQKKQDRQFKTRTTCGDLA